MATRRRCAGLVFMAAILVALACARVRPLSGGPADETPPALVQVTPRDSTTGLPPTPHFEFVFDEALDRNSARGAVRFYPFVRRDVVVKGNRISIQVTDSLPADSTVVLVLGESLQDAKPRGNRLAAERWFVYSTGAQLRAASILGRVSVKGSVAPKGAVRFAPVVDDSAGTTAAPQRHLVAAADDEGLFRMHGIAPRQRFVLVAFLDRNDNLEQDDDEIGQALPDTFELLDGEIVRGLQWNLIDPNEPAAIKGIALNRTRLDGRVAVAFRALARDSTGQPALDSTRAPADARPASGRARPPGAMTSAADSIPALPPLPVAERSDSRWASAWERLEPEGFVRGHWRVVYASRRGDYSIKLPAGRHATVAFVDAEPDSMPGLFVNADSTLLEWEPLWIGDVFEVAPGQERRQPAIDIDG